MDFKRVCGLKDSLKLSKQLGLVTSSIFKVGDELDFFGTVKPQATRDCAFWQITFQTTVILRG